ncbi:hypothetical protein BDN72DRAFT_845082 [Pluteus cervinus]|uniref:Uncharacterized protein n=1 Tax=Pluteus cervinus TaxID=181527 RepID=A0ACD3AIZ4_9AGAR|nr:hypothetical protein BDN72DRAFT_845082 [Pluteus cervinus]
MFSNKSTASLNSTTSTSPLCSTQQPTKSYESAFSRLQTTYGSSGLAPTPVHALPTSQQSSTSNSSKYSKSTKSSQIQLTPQEAALGQLASQYGFSGAYPSVPQKTVKPSSPTSHPQNSGQTPRANPGQKDYAAAFTTLSSQYGYGGSSFPTNSK